MRRLQIKVAGDTVRFGPRFAVTFYRTLRLPADGRTYPLPPGLGTFPVHRVADHLRRVPPAWRKDRGVFIPLYQREALWLGFEAAAWRPNAVQVGVGRVNAVSGGPWGAGLGADPQNYLVCPDQPWLDGVIAGAGITRQFVAMPLGSGVTVEAQVRGAEEFGGIQFLVYEPRPGRFPNRRPAEAEDEGLESLEAPPGAAGPPLTMGLAVGGKVRQKIYPDPHGLEAWEPQARGRLTVHLVNSEQYRAVTGLAAPPTPVTAQLYAAHGLPWFDLDDDDEGGVPAPAALRGLTPVGGEGDAPLDLRRSPVHRLRRPSRRQGKNKGR
jgi:hypothetical protein